MIFGHIIVLLYHNKISNLYYDITSLFIILLFSKSKYYSFIKLSRP